MARLHGAYNPAATEIWHEGLRLPPMRLTENGVLREDLLEMLALNVRHPRDFRGDLAAQIGAARLGEVRLSAVIAEFGAATLAASIEAMLDAAERYARAIVAGWADGDDLGEAVLDDDGFDRTNIVIRARVTKMRQRRDGGPDGIRSAGDRLHQFLARQHAVGGGDGFRVSARPDIAKNAGAFRPLNVKLKEGTIVWAREGAPVTMCTSHRSNEIMRRSSSRCPRRAPSGRWADGAAVADRVERGRSTHRAALHLAHVPGASGRRRVVVRRRLFHHRRWHSSGGIKFGASRWRKGGFPWCSRPTNIGRTRRGRQVSRRLWRRHAPAGRSRWRRIGEHRGRRHGAWCGGMCGGRGRRAARLHAAGPKRDRRAS